MMAFNDCSMVQDSTAYGRLRQQLFETFKINANSYHHKFEEIKSIECFKSDINSPRDFARVKCVNDLITVLEKRNAIHENDVSELVKIICLIRLKCYQSTSYPTWLSKILKSVQEYKSTITHKTCHKCSKEYEKHGVTKQTEQQQQNVNSVQLNPLQSNVAVEQESNKAIETPINPQLLWNRVHIHCDWNFIRNLPGLTEKSINQIREQNGNRPERCLRESFFYWVKIAGLEVTLENVNMALRKAGNLEIVSLN
ncbi:hypothetical protein CHUAL_008879 [Chamberlinius hualienensis]